jgi:SNF2 family DNA or RNA helicase
MVRAKKIEVCPDGNDQNLCEIIYSDGNHKHKSIPEYTWPFLFEQEWDAIVMDESHKILASTYNLQSKKITQGRRGAMYLRKCLKKDGGLPIALSGTPFRSKLVKAWGTLNWVRPDMFTSFWNFAQTHFDVNEGEYGGNEISAEPVDIDAFNAAMRPYYLARDKKTAAPDLPDINYINVIIPMEDKQAKAYSQIKKLAKVRLESGTLNAVGVLAELTRCRQFACAYGDVSIDEEQDTIQFRPELPSSKLDWVLEFLEEREGNAGKVVVASGFTSLLNMASKYVAAQGHANYLLTGKTTDKQRLDIVRKFQDDKDPVSVLFLNMYAGGEAITLDAADDMILLDLPWTSDQEEQLTSRLHRVSRIHNVTVYRLLSENTIDEWMQDLTEEQRRIMLSARPESASLAAGVLIPDWVQ